MSTTTPKSHNTSRLASIARSLVLVSGAAVILHPCRPAPPPQPTPADQPAEPAPPPTAPQPEPET